MGLPALTTELPHALRAQFARADLANLTLAAEMQVQIRRRAVDSARELLRVAITSDIPNSESLGLLLKKHGDHNDSPTELTVNAIINNMIDGCASSSPGVSQRTISKDLLRSSHPDVARQQLESSTDLAAAEELFKLISEARQNGDVALQQALYANAIAGNACNASDNDPCVLELARYKAWIALEATRGRFNSTAEVDAWKQHELDHLATKARAKLLDSAMALFVRSLGATGQGVLHLPDNCFYEIDKGLRSGHKAVVEVINGNLKPGFIRPKEIQDFDIMLGSLIEQLEELLEHKIISAEHDWTYAQSQRALKFANDLQKVANELACLGLTAGIAVSGLLLAMRTKKIERSNF